MAAATEMISPIVELSTKLRDQMLQNYIQAYIDHSEAHKSRWGLTWLESHGSDGRSRALKLRQAFKEEFADSSIKTLSPQRLKAALIAFFCKAADSEAWRQGP